MAYVDSLPSHDALNDDRAKDVMRILSDRCRTLNDDLTPLPMVTQNCHLGDPLLLFIPLFIGLDHFYLGDFNKIYNFSFSTLYLYFQSSLRKHFH